MTQDIKDEEKIQAQRFDDFLNGDADSFEIFDRSSIQNVGGTSSAHKEAETASVQSEQTAFSAFLESDDTAFGSRNSTKTLEVAQETPPLTPRPPATPPT